MKLPRNGSGTYGLPANTLAVSGDPISSTKFNSLAQDIEADLNVDRPVSAGGTGASTAADARTNLGITTNLYNVNASAFVLTILDDADAAAVRTTIGAGTGSGDMLKSENLSGLANYTTARSNLGLAIGTDVQAYSARLADVSGLAVTDGGFIVGNGTNFVLETGATAQASLGYTASDVLTKLLTVDGAGSGLDADTLDGVQGSSYATLTGTQTLTNKTLTAPLLTDQGPTSTAEIGYRGAPDNRRDTNYTLALTDAGKGLVAFGSGGHTWTIPANGSVAFPKGTCILLTNMTSGSITIAITTDTLYLMPGGSTGSRTLASFGQATLWKADTTLWTISGAGLT